MANMSSALRVIDTAPSVEDFTSLQAHQEQTPGSFFGGKAVLHHHVANASLNLSEQELASNAALSVLRSSTDSGAAPQPTSNGDDQQDRVEVTISALSVWVTSDFFTLWSSQTSKGIQIPYPTISLHARQRTALYMQLCLSDISQTADDDLETVELLLQSHAPADTSATDAAEQLYTAVSACADLHPDPDESDDQDPEPEPGAGGWITSENMQDFVDEDGNFRMPEALGAGAGSVRTADQFEDADAGDEGIDGQAESEETKWRRTG